MDTFRKPYACLACSDLHSSWNGTLGETSTRNRITCIKSADQLGAESTIADSRADYLSRLRETGKESV